MFGLEDFNGVLVLLIVLHKAIQLSNPDSLNSTMEQQITHRTDVPDSRSLFVLEALILHLSSIFNLQFMEVRKRDELLGEFVYI